MPVTRADVSFMPCQALEFFPKHFFRFHTNMAKTLRERELCTEHVWTSLFRWCLLHLGVKRNLDVFRRMLTLPEDTLLFIINRLSVDGLGIQEHPGARTSFQKNAGGEKEAHRHLVILNKQLNLKQLKAFIDCLLLCKTLLSRLCECR